MDETRHVDQLDQIKALSDEHRMAILRLLMTGPATLSQLGARLDRHPAWIRHHLKALEQAGLVELTEVRKTGGYIEKYYSPTARAFAVDLMVFPEPTERGLIIILGSDDLALDLLAAELHDDPTAPDVFRLPMGSLEGLIALRRGLGQVAGCHLLDLETGEYNVPQARHLFPGQTLVLVTLAHREQGLLVPPGNPLRICGVGDLVDSGATIVNRNSGSGTRVWFDRLLDERGVDRRSLPGYDDEALTHGDVARAIAAGEAGAGPGIQAAALRFGLGFVPLLEERFDLVMTQADHDSTLLAPLLERIRRPEFRDAVEKLGGYDTHGSGAEITLAA